MLTVKLVNVQAGVFIRTSPVPPPVIEKFGMVLGCPVAVFIDIDLELEDVLVTANVPVPLTVKLAELAMATVLAPVPVTDKVDVPKSSVLLLLLLDENA